jgi:hypothetical protein
MAPGRGQEYSRNPVQQAVQSLQAPLIYSKLKLQSKTVYGGTPLQPP